MNDNIYNFLLATTTYDEGNMSETFYYDRLTKEFFSISIIDYFILDENSKKGDNVKTTYCRKEESIITTKIQRLEREPESFLHIPRLPTKEKIDMLRAFLSAQPDNRNGRQVADKNLRAAGLISFNSTFDIEAEAAIVQEWLQFRNQSVRRFIDEFLVANTIDPAATCVMPQPDEVTISINLKE